MASLFDRFSVAHKDLEAARDAVVDPQNPTPEELQRLREANTNLNEMNESEL